MGPPGAPETTPSERTSTSRSPRISLVILVVCGLAGGLVALTLVTTVRNGDPPLRGMQSNPVGTVRIEWQVGVDPATGVSAWKRTDLGVNGEVQQAGYASPEELPVPWLATIPLKVAVPIGVALGLLAAGAALLLRGGKGP